MGLELSHKRWHLRLDFAADDASYLTHYYSISATLGVDLRDGMESETKYIAAVIVN